MSAILHRMTGGPRPQEQTEPIDHITAFGLSLVMPWVAFRRTWQTLNVRQSLLIHFLGILLFFFGMIILDAVLWYGDITDGLSYIDAIVMLFILVWFLLIQLCYMFTALLTSCWGSNIEPFRASFRRSLARWYQLTPFHSAWTLAFILGINVVNEMRWDYWDYDYGSMSYAFWDFLFSAMILSVFFFYSGIGGWFTLRALAVPGSNAVFHPKSRWPALCETCGYALVGLSQEQTCPECGRSVHSSLNTPRGNTKHTTLAMMRMALLNPKALGEILVTRTRTGSPAKALIITALSLLALGPLGVMYMASIGMITEGQMFLSNIFEFLQLFLVGGLGAGLGSMVIGITIVLAVGSTIGLIDRIFAKRNTLPTACYAACYASGYVLFISLLMYGFTGVIVFFAERIADQMGYYMLEFIPLVWIALVLILTLPYFVIVGRILRGARYANA